MHTFICREPPLPPLTTSLSVTTPIAKEVAKKNPGLDRDEGLRLIPPPRQIHNADVDGIRASQVLHPPSLLNRAGFKLRAGPNKRHARGPENMP